MRVLLGYDGSDFADSALNDLHRAGLPPDVEMIVLCAADMLAIPASVDGTVGEQQFAPTAEGWHARVEEALVGARAVAQRGAARLRTEFPRWSISAEAVADSPGWAIIKRAEGFGGQSWRADLIIMGAAGHSGIGRIFFGSVAHKVLTNARCSTRIGRAVWETSSRPVRLLVGVDGSEDSLAAVFAVARRTWPADTKCRVMSVTDFRMRMSLALMEPPVLPELHAQRLVHKVAESLGAAGLATTTVTKEGDVARCLVDEADDFGADCIFVGARGLGRVNRFLLGSISASVAMRASCTVEVIHPPSLPH